MSMTMRKLRIKPTVRNCKNLLNKIFLAIGTSLTFIFFLLLSTVTENYMLQGIILSLACGAGSCFMYYTFNLLLDLYATTRLKMKLIKKSDRVIIFTYNLSKRLMFIVRIKFLSFYEEHVILLRPREDALLVSSRASIDAVIIIGIVYPWNRSIIEEKLKKAKTREDKELALISILYGEYVPTYEIRIKDL